MPAFLRLVERPAPLRTTLQNEAGEEIASATTAAGEVAMCAPFPLPTDCPGERMREVMEGAVHRGGLTTGAVRVGCSRRSVTRLPIGVAGFVGRLASPPH